MTDDTRGRILGVALDLFASRGYHATSIREIAERLGLTKTAVLYHFPSKKDLLDALAAPMLDGMEAAVDAANRSGGDDFGRTRWAVIEGLLDTWLAHRHMMRMSVQDLALASDADVYRRFRDAMGLAVHLIAGPGADHTDRIRAIQAAAMLSDPVVMLADLPAEMLRPAVLAGVERLFQEPVPAPRREPAPAARREPAARKPGRRGRPGAMSPEMVETARRMRASGDHTAADIAEALGVSRATVFRHLPRD